MAAEGYTPERVRAVLTGESPGLAKQRRVFRRIPSPPRCKLCAAPVAVAAAVDVAERAAKPSTTGSASIPVGTAVHTGVAFVGATGLGTIVDDFTALGDAVNITARLASAAGAGEVIVSVAAAEGAGMATDQLERRTVEIRGRTEPIKVIVLPAARQKVAPDERHV